MGISFDKLKEKIYNIIYALKIHGKPIKEKKKLKNEQKKKIKKKMFEKNNINNKVDKEIKKFNLIKKNKIKMENIQGQITQNENVYSFNRINQKKNFIKN